MESSLGPEHSDHKVLLSAVSHYLFRLMPDVPLEFLGAMLNDIIYNNNLMFAL